MIYAIDRETPEKNLEKISQVELEKIAERLKAGERYFFPQISFAFKFLLTTNTLTTAFLCDHYITQSKIFQYISQSQVVGLRKCAIVKGGNP